MLESDHHTTAPRRQPADLSGCYFCGVADHMFTACSRFTGQELAVYCEYNGYVHIMQHTCWVKATMQDLFRYLETVAGVDAQHFDIYLQNHALVTREPTIKCIDVHITPGTLVFALCRSSCPPPPPPCISLPQGMSALLFEEARVLAHIKEGRQGIWLRQADLPPAVDDRSLESRVPLDRSAQDSSTGVSVPSVTRNLVRDLYGRPWADLTDSVGSGALRPPQAEFSHPDITPLREHVSSSPAVQATAAHDAPTESEGHVGRKRSHRRKIPPESTADDARRGRPQAARPDSKLEAPQSREGFDVRGASKGDFRRGHKDDVSPRFHGNTKSTETDPAALRARLARTIHIKFLPNDVEPSWLMQRLSAAGTVLKVRLCEPGTSFRICFVEFETPESAERLIRTLSGKVVGQNLRLALTHPNAPITVINSTDADDTHPCTFGLPVTSPVPAPRSVASAQATPPSALGPTHDIVKPKTSKKGDTTPISSTKKAAAATPPTATHQGATPTTSSATQGQSTPTPTAAGLASPPSRAVPKTFAQVAKEARSPPTVQSTPKSPAAAVTRVDPNAKPQVSAEPQAPPLRAPTPAGDDLGRETTHLMPFNDLLVERLTSAQLRLRRVSAATDSSRFEATIAVAEAAAQLHVSTSASHAFDLAENHALLALTMYPLTAQQVRAKVLLVALLVHAGSVENAGRYASMSYTFDAFGRGGRPEVEPVTPTVLNHLITIGLLLEASKPELAGSIYASIREQATAIGVPCPVLVPPMRAVLLPGIVDLPVAVLSGHTVLRVF